MEKFKAFENDSQSITVGEGNGITFENGKNEIVIYGDTTITKDSDPLVVDKLLEILTGIKENLSPKPHSKIIKP